MTDRATIPEMGYSADLSPCLRYRYLLRRIWMTQAPGPVAFIMLNPSTADAQADDPTIRRCVGFARRWGYGGIVVANLYAYRATDPQELREQPDPIGPDNDMWLRTASRCPCVVAAWGAHPMATGAHANRVRAMLEAWIPPQEGGLKVLGLTAGGHPRHPLYMKNDARPVPWRDAAIQATKEAK